MIIKRHIVIDLIKQDLINCKLIKSFDQLEINAENYLLDILESILEIMELEEHKHIDRIFNDYLKMSQRAMSLATRDPEINELAAEIYEYLRNMKKGNIPIYES